MPLLVGYTLLPYLNGACSSVQPARLSPLLAVVTRWPGLDRDGDRVDHTSISPDLTSEVARDPQGVS